nr:hypothetical protein [Neochlamydia sp. EPS4]
MRQHGKAKRRIWRKIHLAICQDLHEIILSELTKSNKADDAANQMILQATNYLWRWHR